MSFFDKLPKNFRNLEISTKITLTYVGCFMFLLILIEMVMYAGFLMALYRPAGKTIDFSIAQVKPWLDNIKQRGDYFNSDTMRQPLVTGVVVRVFDDAGNLLEDTDENYPSNESFNDCKLDYQPMFADADKEVALMTNAWVYRAKMDYVFKGEHFTLYFYRTITSEVPLLEEMKYILLILDLIGIIFAVAVGHFMSRKVLKPIKIMTEHAQNIAYGKMDGRIEIKPTNDELTELAKTFNSMLDRIKGGIDDQQKFINFVSHALLNPATAISFGIETIKHYGVEDKNFLNETIDIISTKIQNIDKILQSMLFLIHAEQNCLKIKKEDFDLSYILEDAVNEIQKADENHSVELRQNDFANVYGDSVKIRRMLMIFLENAVDYTPTGGKIIVTSQNDNGTITLSISDSGIGIAPENVEHIFEKFFSVKSRLNNNKGGGLSLPIAKWIADKHDIKIEVDSTLNVGTTFTLTIFEAPIPID